MKKIILTSVLLFLLFIPHNSYSSQFQLTIQPIFLTDAAGSLLTSGPLPEEELDKIWAQADIDIDFLDYTTYFSPSSYSIDPYEISSFFANAQGYSSDPQTLNMWFIGDIYSTNILGVTSSIPSNKMLIVQDVLDNNYFGVLAHEIGHCLGLEHVDDPLGMYGSVFTDPTNLMSSWYYGGVNPYDIGDIYPDGEGWDRLIEQQISIAQSSTYLKEVTPVPEPATMLLFGFGLLGFAGIGRRKK